MTKTVRRQLYSLAAMVMISSVTVSFSAYAKTVEDYRREAEEAAKEADKIVKERIDAANREAEAEKILLDKAMERNAALIRGVHDRMQVSASQKSEHFREEKEEQHKKRFYIIVNESYVQQLSPLAEKARQILKEFDVYRQTEGSNKDLLQKTLIAARQDLDLNQLIDSHSRLHSLMQNESTNKSYWVSELSAIQADLSLCHQSYLNRIDSMRPFFKKYDVPELGSPLKSIRKLTRALEYTQKRADFFQEYGKPTLDHFSDQISSWAQSKVEKKKEMQALNEDLGLEFKKTISGLIARSRQLKRESPLKVGCLKRIRPLFDVYQEILSYENLCSDLEHLRKSKSVYFSGCRLLPPALDSAKEFFNATARSRMHFTITLGQTTEGVPYELREELRHLADGFEAFSLLQAIQLHDDLIQKWHDSKQNVPK